MSRAARSSVPSAADYRQLRLCSGGGALEAVPREARTLDLERLATALRASGVPVVDARSILIVTLDTETTVSRAGRLLFKTRDEAVAARAFRRVLEAFAAGD